MKKTIAPLALPVLCAALLTACATGHHTSATTYDFGNAKETPSAAPAIGPISIADPRTPVWLDGPQMIYRLRYDNDLQAHTYAANRWVMPPAQLFVERLKTRIAQAGGTVLPAADGALGLPVLRLEMNDFTQIFDTPGNSVGQISVRATVLQGRVLTAQKNFARQVPAPSADAAGGARALATASDAVIEELMNWLASLPPAEKR